MFDFDCDGKIDALDLSYLITYFGNVYTANNLFEEIRGVNNNVEVYNLLGAKK